MIARSILLSLIAAACVAAILLAGCTGTTVKPPSTPVPTPVPTPVRTPVPAPALPPSFDQTDNGGNYSVSLGAAIELRLPENPTTGYSWNLSVPAGIAVLNDSYLPSETSGGVVGSGGTRIWFLKAVQPGEQVVSGVYRRPWEPVAGNETGFRLTLLVSGSTCGENVCTLPGIPVTPPDGS